MESGRCKVFRIHQGLVIQNRSEQILKEWTMLKHERVSATDLKGKSQSRRKQKKLNDSEGDDLFLHV
jgi:hypothetical protein